MRRVQMLDINKSGKALTDWQLPQDSHYLEGVTVATITSLEEAGFLHSRLEVVRSFLEELRSKRSSPTLIAKK